MTHPLFAAALIVASSLALATPAQAIQERVANCGCQPPYMQRLADPEDYVCVRRSSARAVVHENQEAAAHTIAGGACASGYVWRDAFDGDAVCVTPKSRTRVHTENQNAASHMAPLCYLGLYNSQ